MKAAAVSLASCLVTLAAGCLDSADFGFSGCDTEFLPETIRAGAPGEGGRGPRTLLVDAAGGDGLLLAWWLGDDNGTVEVARLRSMDGLLVLRAPNDRELHLLSGRPTDGGSVWRIGLRVPAGGDLEVTLADPATGSVDGTWSDPVSVGPAGASWQPHDLPLASAIEALDLTLSWTNGPSGGADLGIAVASGASTFNYRNAAYQATPGAQSESRHLDANDLAQLGWGDATPAKAGPSISTGGFASTGIAYTLQWSADLAPPDPSEAFPCTPGNDLREVDVTGGA